MSLNIDIAPTILKLAAIEPEADLFHGRDIYTEPLPPRDWWFYEHLFDHPDFTIPINLGIRSLQYKYLLFPEHNYEMLFDLDRDPQETVNLAQERNYREAIAKYRQLVRESEQKLS